MTKLSALTNTAPAATFAKAGLKALSLTLMAGVSAAVLAGAPAKAEDELELSANVALTTNYIYRGITQTDDGPAIQGGFDLTYGLFYAGTWASSVDFGDDTTMEIDFYAGVTPSWGEFDFDFGVLYYAYPDSPDDPEQDFIEFYGSVSTAALEVIELGAGVAYSPDFYAETGNAWYFSGEAAVPLPEDWSISATVGYSDIEEADNYTDYSIGISKSAWGLDFDLRYHGTSGADDFLGEETSTGVFTIGKSF